MTKTKLLLILLLFTYPLAAQSYDSNLDKLIGEAIRVSPKLKMLRVKQSVSESRIPQVSNLPDPTLTFGAMNLPVNSFKFTQEPMTSKIIGLSQAVPFPGKLSAAEKAQAKDVEINQQEIDDAVNEIINEVKKYYYDLRFYREAIRIADKSKNLLDKIAEVVRTKYAVSKASQQNLIQIEVEITKINDKIEELKSMENSALTALNSLLLKEPASPIETDSIPGIHNYAIDFNGLVKTAEENRPFLKGILLAKEKSKLTEALYEYEFYPNFNFSIQYSQRDKIAATNAPLNDFLSFVVGLNIPLDYGGKKSSKVEEARLMQQLYADQYNLALQTLYKNFGALLARLNEFKEREKLIEDGLLPQAVQSLNAALANYQVGEIDFINVLDAQNKVYEIETNLYKIRTNFFKEISQLEFLTGKRINKEQF
ncbi:TolC family protein [Melioribacter sp. Ez-97]|jgi:outer membrane protein TolC|uniref:TolC family protein n=1 Tax=Melioribacter sp. Ez-97 TaxID=3423434 RepID=UPI003ED99C6D